jgi:hypothetical protein
MSIEKNLEQIKIIVDQARPRIDPEMRFAERGELEQDAFERLAPAIERAYRIVIPGAPQDAGETYAVNLTMSLRFSVEVIYPETDKGLAMAMDDTAILMRELHLASNYGRPETSIEKITIPESTLSGVGEGIGRGYLLALESTMIYRS